MDQYLVYGLGISGISTAKTLASLGNKVYIYDEKEKEKLTDTLNILEEWGCEYIKDFKSILKKVDILVKSPGIPNTNPNIAKARAEGLEVISDLELVTRLYPEREIIAITGTNGKTTTSSLMKEILLACGKKAKAIGNIGLGMLWELHEGNEDEVYIIECSSFQLDGIIHFKPHISAIINITPDHLDWHGSFDEYYSSKKNIFKNQTQSDYCIMNVDDPSLKELEKEVPTNIIQVASRNPIHQGIQVKGDSIYAINDTIEEYIMKLKEIPLKGNHNRENVLITLGISKALGLPIDKVVEGIRGFKAVEHRLEYVSTIKGIEFYNDSKGTNIDASIKAIKSFESPIILLAGGYDKKIDLKPFFQAMDGKVKYMILFGDTREKFAKLSESFGLPYKIVENMEQAIKVAFENSDDGDVVLLSPASAAWGMYPNFEIRGRDFKDQVRKLREENGKEI